MGYLKGNSETREAYVNRQRQMLLEKATTSSKCKICKIKFRREELKRVVTDTLITTLTAHLRKRGVFTLE